MNRYANDAVSKKIHQLLEELLQSHADCIHALRAAENYGHTHPDAWKKGEEKRESFNNIREAVTADLVKLATEDK